MRERRNRERRETFLQLREGKTERVFLSFSLFFFSFAVFLFYVAAPRGEKRWRGSFSCKRETEKDLMFLERKTKGVNWRELFCFLLELTVRRNKGRREVCYCWNSKYHCRNKERNLEKMTEKEE